MSFIERGKGPWPVNNQLHTVQRWITLRLGGGYEDREIQSVQVFGKGRAWMG